MATKPTFPDPYSAFKDDNHRLKALIARDLRYVAIAGLLFMANEHIPWQIFFRLLNMR